MSTVPGRPDLATVAVGDIVKVGKGKKLWRVDYLWPNQPIASLIPLDGYSRTSAHLTRLTVVDRPIDTRPDGAQEPTC